MQQNDKDTIFYKVKIGIIDIFKIIYVRKDRENWMPIKVIF